jgi:hypothetical protein
VWVFEHFTYHIGLYGVCFDGTYCTSSRSLFFLLNASMFDIYMVCRLVLALNVYIYGVKYLVHYMVFITYIEVYFLKCRVYIYVYFYECCSLFYYCVHAVRDQTAQTTIALFISHFINFKDYMYLYINTFYHISYCNNFLLIIHKLM